MRLQAALPILLLVLAALLSGCGKPQAPVAPQGGPALRLEEVVGGLAKPVQAVAAPGSEALYVVEQGGTVRRWEAGSLSELPLLDLSDRTSASGERGLLGLAFHPGYAQNGRLFVHYTDSGGDTVLSEWRATPGGATAVPGSERVLLTVEQPYANHNGGMIAFGPDGHLYLALGDGGSRDDPHGHGQDLGTLLGKLLRLDVDAPPPAGQAYAVPADNPFVGRAGKDEVWAYGLRNPWRFSFDRATGDLWIADVGQDRIEEVNVQRAGSHGGENYGWDVYEGSDRHSGSEPNGEVTMPVAEYDHDGGHCAVTGGYVHRGPQEALRGWYLFGDYCTGQLWGTRADPDGGWETVRLLDTEALVSSFGEGSDGEVYVVDHRGSVWRVVADEGN